MRTPSLDDPDLPLAQIFQHWPATAAAFIERKVLCFGCPIAPFHTVIDAVAEYDLNEEEFRARLRDLAFTPA